jgi:RND family efflux transporter MFP subunit
MYDIKRWLFLLLLGVIAFGCHDKTDQPEGKRDVVVDPSTVEVIGLVEVDELYRGVGTVAAKTAARISAKVMGSVVEVRVSEGDNVEDGALLVVLSSKELASRAEAARNAVVQVERNLAEAEADRQEAAAQLELARITYERFKTLRERESVSIQEFDEAKAKLNVARARVRRAEEAIGSFAAKKKQALSALEEAETFLEYTRISAPFAGVITLKEVNEGDLAQPGTLLLVLEDKSIYRLEASVDEANMSSIFVGQEVVVSVDALEGEQLRGTVSEVVPRIDPATRKFVVKVDLPTTKGITSGMYGKAYFPVGKNKALLIPRTALAECGQLSTIYVVNGDGRVERRLVKTGKEYGDRIEVLTGLDAGESIVVRDVHKLTEGCLVGRRP